MGATPRLVRTRGAAEYCGLAESTLEKLRCYGGGPKFIRRAKSVFYAVDDLDKYLAALPRYDNTSQADADRGAEAA